MATDKFSRIESKIDHISSRLGSIDTTLAAQHVSLKEHMRRTDILEKSVEPLTKHVTMINGALKLLGAMVVLAGVASSIVAVLEFIRK